MRLKIDKFIIYFLLMLLLGSCSRETRTAEVTHLVSQTNDENNLILQSTGTPVSIAIQTQSISIPITPDYFDGFVVLTSYYIFLDQGAYNEAVSLYSLSKQNINGSEADIDYFRSSLASIEIGFIQPYNYWLAQQGLDPTLTNEGEMRFVVGTIVVYKGESWNAGTTPVPYRRISFISLIMENGDWKIDEINSSPWFPQP